tara:strand:- start:3696 stop:4187 length:492 start_codon:yes stop_codon:yes gene_type:complete
MNSLLASGAAVIIGVLIWSRQNKTFTPFLKKNKNNLNHTEISVVLEKNLLLEKSNQITSSHNKQKPLSNKIALKCYRDRVILRKQLTKLIKGNPEERFYAVQLSNHLKWKEAIKILNKGLRDFDSRIVIESAKRMEKYKKQNNNPIHQDILSPRLPRNVFLMR